MNKRGIGKRWEEAACSYLLARGVKIRDRNFKCYRNGELDIIGTDSEGCLIFVEVKYRKTQRCGRAEEAVTWPKQMSICRAADYYRLRHGIGESQSVRFDVIAVMGEGEISWIKNAFDYIPL